MGPISLQGALVLPLDMIVLACGHEEEGQRVQAVYTAKPNLLHNQTQFITQPNPIYNTTKPNLLQNQTQFITQPNPIYNTPKLNL